MLDSKSLSGRVGDRIECGTHFGTVKYVGPIEGTSSVWLGIDWDDPSRGKHDGSAKGVKYFTTRNPKSGSFVRPEKVNFGKSAIASIESRYGHLDDEFTTKVNQQKQLLIQQTMNAPFLQMVGFDKVFNKQSDFAALKVVNLRNQNVSSAGPTLRLGETCPNIEELDISKNLLASWEDVFAICQQLVKLHWLNVSENFLNMPTNRDNYKFPNVRTLICGSMEINWDDVIQIEQVFPGVEEFRAPHNKIENIFQVEDIFLNLKLLDIEGNRIEKWAEICKLGHLPQLEHLNLENIQLSSIEFDGEAPKVAVFENLEKLCIADNLLSEWRSIGELNRLKSLENFKISKNPIMESEDRETALQIIIARIANLKILNGVEIESGERRGAEYDYIKKYGLEWLKIKGTELEPDFLKSHNRYLELIEKYGEPEESELLMKPKIIKSSLVELDLVFEDSIVKKRLPPTMTVQKLMMLTQKLFSLDERPQLMYKSTTDSHIEISLEDELREIGLYSIQDGDQIIVRK